MIQWNGVPLSLRWDLSTSQHLCRGPTKPHPGSWTTDTEMTVNAHGLTALLHRDRNECRWRASWTIKPQPLISNTLSQRLTCTSEHPWFCPWWDLGQRSEPVRCGSGAVSQGNSWEKYGQQSASLTIKIFSNIFYSL